MIVTRKLSVSVAAAVLIVAGAPTYPSAAQSPSQGGRVVVGIEGEPLGLNPTSICCLSTWTEMIADVLLPGAYAPQPDFSYVPDVISGEAVVGSDPFSLTYEIKEEAAWNDGMPVSARDFVFTWRVHVDPDNALVSRSGYELIESAHVAGPKTVTFRFRKSFPAYRALFDEIFPRHVLEGRDFDRVWRNRIPVSAGPFEFGEWERGSHLTLIRNDEYWGDQAALLDEVVFLFFETDDVRGQRDALKQGAVDVIYPSTLRSSLAELHDAPGIDVQNSPGAIWEHLDFQFKDPLLRLRFVREAISFAIDRQGIVDRLVKPLDPAAETLNNLVYLRNQREYEDHFGIYGFDPRRSENILQDHGCSRNEEGIYECRGRPLDFTYISTARHKMRIALSRMIKDQLADVGIVIRRRHREPAIAFGNVLVQARWDLFNFAWVGTSDPGLATEIWMCEGGSNFNNYCNEDVTYLLKQTRREMDPDRRAHFFDRADELMAIDLPVLPLYQRPTFLAHDENVRGLVDNPTEAGPTWNIEDWWIRSE